MNYKLVNNHYIVNIDGKNYLIDTGSPVSFWTSEPIKEVTINNRAYALQKPPYRFNAEETNELVNFEIDGFIGMDIISQTGLTIRRGEGLEFAVEKVEGIQVPMTKGWPLMAYVGCNMMSGRFIIDTGAMYGYGISGLFYDKKPYDHVRDYNPSLGHLDSDIYTLDIVIGGQNKSIDVCDNRIVASTLRNMAALMIGSVSSLFEEVCVLDTINGKLLLK